MRHKTVLIIVILLLLALVPAYTIYADRDEFRVAYLEGDPYINYAGNLSGLARGLEELGWVDSTEGWGYADGSDDAAVLWNWLGTHSREGLVFVPDEFYQLIYMSEEEQAEFVRHIDQDGEIDLLLVMGTAAARFVRQSGMETDIMVMSVTDAVEAGIVEGAEYSGVPNVWAYTSPGRYYNQLNVFYYLFPFERLGLVYENSEKGRNEISYETIRRFAADKDIQLVEAPVEADQAADGPALYEQKMIEGYHSLTETNADAVYMTNTGFRSGDRLMEYLTPLYEKGVPVFSQTGKTDVRNGAILTIYRYSFDESGSFCAGRFVEIMEGAGPGSLSQNYDEAQALCFNMAAARVAGIQIPFKALISADAIYSEIGEVAE